MLTPEFLARLQAPDLPPLPPADGENDPDPGWAGLQSSFLLQLDLRPLYLEMADEGYPGLADEAAAAVAVQEAEPSELYQQVQAGYATYSPEIRRLILERCVLQDILIQRAALL